jgi:circadian clock protein KaiC
MADCVVKVQHRVASGTALRFIRVAKCRGGPHSANEFPFTIGPAGIEVGAGAATEMIHPASKVTGFHGRRAPRCDARRRVLPW